MWPISLQCITEARPSALCSSAGGNGKKIQENKKQVRLWRKTEERRKGETTDKPKQNKMHGGLNLAFEMIHWGFIETRLMCEATGSATAINTISRATMVTNSFHSAQLIWLCNCDYQLRATLRNKTPLLFPPLIWTRCVSKKQPK